MATIFRLRALAAEFGDCLWLEYGDEKAPHRVLVDAGTGKTAEKLMPMLAAVRAKLPSHELLIVTHVDRDHIGGILPVVADEACRGQFKDLWFNAYHHMYTASNQQAMGAVQGDKLTDWLVGKDLPWNEAFGGKGIYFEKDGALPTATLDGGMKVTILSPGIPQLSKMLGRWEDEVKRAGLDLDASPDVRRERVGEQALGGLDVNALANAATKTDPEEPNGTSIATLHEYNDCSVLLAADAHPQVLIAGIKKLAAERGLPKEQKLEVDVFKLPHHGSKKNVTKTLMSLVSARAYIFSSNGVSYFHPDREAVARVIQAHGDGANLLFNYRTKFNEMWDDDDLRDQWKYSAGYGAGEAGIEVDVMQLKAAVGE